MGDSKISLKDKKFWLLVILLLPVIFINPNKYHAWGGDFALYLNQAIHFVEGKSIHEIGFIINPDYPSISPQHYPMGFPLLLSIPYLLFGYDIQMFSYFISFFLFGTGILSYLILRLDYKFFPSFFGALLLTYHPLFVKTSIDILPDIPIMFFILLTVFLFKTVKTWRGFLILGCIIGYTMLIKSVGIVVWIALLIYFIYNLIIREGGGGSLIQQRKNLRQKIYYLNMSLYYFPLHCYFLSKRLYSIQNHLVII